MKNISALLLIFGLGWLLTYIGPWYLLALAGFAGGLLTANQWRGLLIGFLGGFILWSIQLVVLKQASASDLPERMAELIGVGSGIILLGISASIGGLVSGFGAAAGGALTQKKKSRRY